MREKNVYEMNTMNMKIEKIAQPINKHSIPTIDFSLFS